MNYYKKSNLVTGWITFAIASLVYILTMEPTSSLWDCSEFIATSYKLEVGHPPGAPLFMMIARFFTIFAPSPEAVPVMVNTMSSLCGGFTVLFLFWSITHLARKFYARNGEELTKAQTWTVLGAGLVGALAYCFTDTQWFSAVEGEVYSMSSMFTAMVFWAILQWENVADQPHSSRWLILIAYLMGLSIGIHILNLLTIPALVFVYYFKKYPTVTKWGVVLATLASGAILIAVNYILIPYSVTIGAWFDRLFVNGMGLPVNSGITTFALLAFVLLGWLVWYTHKKGKVLANIIVLCTTVILLGYASYASVVIRAVANPPMNSNNPNNPYALLSLLNRDQYGDRPLLYGPYYSSPPSEYKYKDMYYMGEDGKYKKTEVISGLEYPDEFMYFFPRMYKSGKEAEYKAWGNVTGNTVRFHDQMINVPTAGENMRYFFSYQLNYMYWRYFLWNFVGRQNDIQGSGDLLDGNWLSGVKPIDALYLGPQDDIPSEMADNRARNRYFFLPFILGLIGLIYQLNRDKRNFTVVMWLFLMMGIVLVFYFNTTPGEPRERDYVYAGSFYAFCIWIGLGVICIRDWLVKLAKKDAAWTAVAATVVCASVPVILCAQNWDDHDRSHRYVARDIGWNYLNATLPNSIILNFGDNDTFPLWYNQEVEEVRTDVRVMNTSYLGGDWYIDQMRIKSNESEPVPFSLPRSKYVNNNDHIQVEDIAGKPMDLQWAMNIVKSEDKRTKLTTYDGRLEDFFPAKKILLPVNKENAIASGIVKPEDAHLMVDTLELTIDSNGILKNNLMLLDLLANFNWERPIYFTQSFLAVYGLRDYLQFDGYAWRLVPIKTPVRTEMEIGRVDTEYLYHNLMETFRYGNVADPRVNCDYFVQHNFSASKARNAFAILAKALIMEGDTARAVKVLDAGLEKIPFSQIRHTYVSTIPHIESYYLAGAYDKGNAVLEDYARVLEEYILYYTKFEGRKADMIFSRMQQDIQLLDELHRIATVFGQKKPAQDIDDFFSRLGL